MNDCTEIWIDYDPATANADRWNRIMDHIRRRKVFIPVCMHGQRFTSVENFNEWVEFVPSEECPWWKQRQLSKDEEVVLLYTDRWEKIEDKVGREVNVIPL